MEGDSAALYRSDVVRYLLAQEADLQLALDGQIDIIRDYELRIAANKDGMVELSTVTALLDGAKKKRAEIEAKLNAAKAKLTQVEKHWTIYQEIHDAVHGYLEEPGFSAADAGKLIAEVGELRGKGAKNMEEK